MATIKDVAKLAGVSVTTVSIIMNGKSGERKISAQTQERVQDAMREPDCKTITFPGEQKTCHRVFLAFGLPYHDPGIFLKCTAGGMFPDRIRLRDRSPDLRG